MSHYTLHVHVPYRQTITIIVIAVLDVQNKFLMFMLET